MMESETDVAIERAKIQPNSRNPRADMPKPAYSQPTLAAPVGALRWRLYFLPINVLLLSSCLVIFTILPATPVGNTNPTMGIDYN